MVKRGQLVVGDGSSSEAEGSSRSSGQLNASSPRPGRQPGPRRVVNAAFPGESSLVLCRNRHLRNISCFYGSWLQFTLEKVEIMANTNWNKPRPWPIDPAVFFDILKIRRLVDAAADLSIRAASDGAFSSTPPNHNGRNNHNHLGIGGSSGPKLSPKRKAQMRDQAVQKLAAAYRIDEIACSVAVMQGSLTLNDIGALTLHRNPDNTDAKYVHFFHEKVPSRFDPDSTPLTPLSEIIDEKPWEPATWRTRAMIRTLKGDFIGAANDLTEAMRVCSQHRPHGTGNGVYDKLSGPAVNRPPTEMLPEAEWPDSLDTQLLVQRANVFLTIACNHLEGSFSPSEGPDQDSTSGSSTPVSHDIAEKRKVVKLYARSALKDFMAYLSRFDYSPDAAEALNQSFLFKDRTPATGRSTRKSNASEADAPKCKVYPISELFNPIPPSDLPPFPPDDMVPYTGSTTPPHPPPSNEAATYHPLITEALHNLLLCHCLLQTSSKELRRHANMVARIIRLVDPQAVFQFGRSPARADWTEIIRRTGNWIHLVSSWDHLCLPAPLPTSNPHKALGARPQPDLASAAAASLGDATPSSVAAEEAAEQARIRRINQRAVEEAFTDDRVVDEESFRAAVDARKQRAEDDHKKLLEKQRAGGAAEIPTPPSSESVWTDDDKFVVRHCSIITERAAAVARWVIEAPAVTSLAKRKKKPAAKKLPAPPKGAASSSEERIRQGIGKMSLGDEIEDAAQA